MLGLLIAASIVGTMLFVGLIVLPLAFIKLPQNLAGVYVRKLFPIYHIVLFVASQVAGLVAYTPHLKPIAFVAALLFALHFVFLTPAINKASDLGNTHRFKMLHRLSVLVHGLILVLFVFALYADACFF